MNPTLPGWKVETVGDDIAWMKFGADGRLYAINPEAGFFGVAPGTSHRSNPNAMLTVEHDAIFTNCALTPEGDIWWEEMTETPPPQLSDWLRRPWTPASHRKAAHPNARFTAPARQCPVIAPEWEDPKGVPISAILFGGRRATVLPFCGYHMGDYFGHWLKTGARADAAKLPRIFHVNWFRKGEDGKFLWPGYGENSRVLKWVFERVQGTGKAVDTPIGRLPAPGALDLSGLRLPEAALRALLRVDVEGWNTEVLLIKEHYERFGSRLPQGLSDELAALEQRLQNAKVTVA